MDDTSSRYFGWKVPDLKAELIKRGAVTTGRKQDLIERLEAYDRNENFQEDPVLSPEPLDVGWPVTGYKQVLPEHKSLLPTITREHIEAYFLYRLADDRQCTSDLKALVKGQDMYDSNKVLACSISTQDDIYLTGIVGASMKQKVTYNYKVRVSKQSGDPLNTHCECAAGRGPHGTCKHVAVVCIMLSHFTESGTMKKAMSFNKPKAYYSATLAYHYDLCSKFSKDLSFRYLYERADLQVASKFHDYCHLPHTELMVDNALKVGEHKVRRIEESTRGQSKNIKWFEAREWRLTASRFGEICKATCRRNTEKLCNSLLHSNIKTKAILHGKNYEKKALRLFEEKLGIKTKECGLFVSLGYPYLGVSPDAIVDDSALVEIKCSYSGQNEMVKPGAHFGYLMYDDNENIVLKKSCNYFIKFRASCT